MQRRDSLYPANAIGYRTYSCYGYSIGLNCGLIRLTTDNIALA